MLLIVSDGAVLSHRKLRFLPCCRLLGNGIAATNTIGRRWDVTADEMKDRSQQPETAREMVRAHAYPLFAAISALSLFATCILLIPQAVKTHRYNLCVDAQIQMREAINVQGSSRPGKLNYLKAIEHCEGR